MGATRGLIRQKDKIESGRRQRSERPTCIRFADYLLTHAGTAGPITIAHHAQRRHTRPLFAENTKSCSIGAMERAGRLIALCSARMAASGILRRVARFVGPQASQTRSILFAKKTKSSPVDPDGASHPHPSALQIRHTHVKWSRTHRNRPPCTAPPHEGLIRRKHKIVSGRRQWSDPPDRRRFAGLA